MIKRFHPIWIALCLQTLTVSAVAQTTAPTATQSATKSATVSQESKVVPKLLSQPFDHMFELPAPVLQTLSLTTKQKELLDQAHMSRRQLWSAMRNARMQEYAALTKSLEQETFDPKEVIALRKKIRATVDKRIDEVQGVWLDFWEALNPGQRKSLVGYMKQQHMNNAVLSQKRAAEERAANPLPITK